MDITSVVIVFTGLLFMIISKVVNKENAKIPIITLIGCFVRNLFEPK